MMHDVYPAFAMWLDAPAELSQGGNLIWCHGATTKAQRSQFPKAPTQSFYLVLQLLAQSAFAFVGVAQGEP
jgi:hypothetical protein